MGSPAQDAEGDTAGGGQGCLLELKKSSVSIPCLHIRSIEFLLHYNAVDLFFLVSEHFTKSEKTFAGIFFPIQKEIQLGTKWELFINQNMPINTVEMYALRWHL